MKTDKEYPATHSMDTAWFACDLDGNVAIFQFEEDGPGPIPFTDIHTDELITKLGKKRYGYYMMPFNKEQIEELKRGLKPVHTKEEIRLQCNILINPKVINDFIKAGAKFDLCYSVKEGFYHLDYWDLDDYSILDKLIGKGDVLGAQECDIEIYFQDCRNDCSEHRLAHFPFYVYEQGAINFPPGRVVVPKIPMKVEQMSENAKKYMLKLPVRFAEKEYVEPAEFIDSQCWSFNNHTKEVGGVIYMQVALTDGGYGYVKVVPHSFDLQLTDEWKSAPRVIDKSDEYIEINCYLIMKTDKEYPATHSMSTAWYCVDEDGNVGIFDIDDNGPVPVGGYEENTVDDIFWEDFSHEGKPYKILHLKPEQIPQMLESSDIKDVWMEDEIGESRSNVSWMNVIIQIDMNKLEVLLEAFSMDDGPCHSLICLSEKMGLFFVDFFSNKKGLELLKKNSVIKAKYRTLEYDYTDEDDSEELMRIHKENQRFPVYIYRQNYWPFHDPAIRVTNPESPLRIEQLPEDVRKKIKKIPVKFKEWEKIQLAEFLPVDILSIEYVYNGQIWCELASSDDSQIYYNVKTKAIINKETMDKLIAEGKAEEFDWDKHRYLKK